MIILFYDFFFMNLMTHLMGLKLREKPTDSITNLVKTKEKIKGKKIKIL